MAASSPISLDFLPRPLRKALLNFQKEGVRFGIRKQGRCLIGDEMGLGKTLQAISIAYYYKDAWPLLIVVPSSVKFSWIDEIEKWLPEVEPHNINLIRSGSDISNLGKAIIHVIGYGLLSVGKSKLLTEALETHKFNFIILDESHYLKTRKAARTKRLHQLCKKAKHAILLSGTPSLARPREVDIVCPGKFGSFSSFVNRYCDAHCVYYRGERHYDTSGASNLNELYNLLKMHVMIRRLKKEVLTQLPPKRRQKVTFDISESSSKYKQELQQTMKDFKKCSAILKGDADDPSIQSPLFEMNRLSMLLYHYTGLVKIGPVLKYIEDLAQGMDSKFIVFFRHRLVREAIVRKLVALKIKHICIAGDVSSGIRGDLVHSFQSDPQVRIAVLSIEAASFGLTLTAAHHVVFAELHHTPGVIIQAEDRAHRIGQTLPVNVHYLIAKGTVDEILWGMIRRKVYVTSSTLDGVCKELKAEDGDEDQGRQLSACAAWIQDQEEDADELEDLVMAQLSLKTNKQDQSQTDLRSFFSPTPSVAKSSQSNWSAEKLESNSQQVTAKMPIKNMASLLESDDENLSVWNGPDDDDDTLMSVSLEVPEERTIQEYEQSTCTTESRLQINSSLDGDSNHVTHSEEQSTNDEKCRLKPKMIKFKKEKHGKLTFARSESYTKLKNTQFKASPLKIVGNDPDSESQTLRGYLDDDCEPGVGKAEEKDGCCEKTDCRSDDDKRKDRGFLASLQETDIECVAVVCKQTPSLTAQRSSLSLRDESASRTSQQGENDGIDHQKREAKPDDNEEGKISSAECDLLENAHISESAISNASSFAALSCMPQSEEEQVSSTPESTCTWQNECSTEEASRLGTHSVSAAFENGNMKGSHPVGNEVNQNGNSLGLERASTLTPSKADVSSSQSDFPCAHHDSFPGENVDHRCELPAQREDEDVQSLKEITAVKPVECSSNSSNCSRHLNEDTSSKPDVEVKTGGRPAFIDQDSADDFEVSGVKQSQSVGPALSKKPTKGKRKAKNKVNNKTAIRKGRNTKHNNKEPPSWSCSACTFINDGQLVECSICFTPRVTANEDNTQNTDNIDCDDSIKKTPDVEMVESTGISVTQMDAKGIGAVISASGEIQNGTSISSGEVSSQRTESDDSRGSTVLPETIAYHGKDSCNSGFRDKVGVVDDSGLPPWSCSVCTFVNMSELIECSMCLTPRRRSQRLSTSKYAHEGHENKNKQNRKRRWKRDTVKKDEIRRVDICSNSTLERIYKTSSGDRVTDAQLESLTVEKLESFHCDSYAPVESGDKGLTPEQMDSLCDLPSSGLNITSQDNLTVLNEKSSTIKSRPRKRLKLDELEDINTPSDEVDNSDFSDDSGSPHDTGPVLARTDQKGPMASGATDEKGIANIEDCSVVLKDVDTCKRGKLCSQTQHQLENPDKNNSSDQGDLRELTDRSIDMIDSSETVVEKSVSETADQRKEVKNLEELKAAVEEVFISEWEDDDDGWWEDNSSSGQSSHPSSGDTTSSSQSVSQLNTGFTKCSDLYSITELRNKLQSTPEQPKVDSTVLQNTPPLELAPDHEMPPPPPVHQENCASAVEEDETDEPEEIPEPMKLKFCLSLYTERVYLYDEDDKPLGINFCMSDVVNGSTEDLPIILRHDYNLRQAKRLIGAWKRMGEGKKRAVRKSALVFDDPLVAYEHARKGVTRQSSYVRHPSKDTQMQKVIDIAGEIGGKVHVVVKKPRITTKKRNSRTEDDQKANGGPSCTTSTPMSTNPTLQSASATQGKTCYQAVRADGIPLCLCCSAPVQFADNLKCSDWDKRFCSHDCKKEYQVRVSGTSARRELFEAERGVCQLCSLDAHSLYTSIKVLHVRDRPAYLAQTPYASLPQQTLKKMVMEPKEGMFWEADHIIPVSEGGGECGLDNYRTLCIMCHRKATEELNKRLKQRKNLQYAAGYADISTFFRPLS